MLVLCALLFILGSASSFLLDNGGANSTISNDRSYQDLISLIIDEKNSMHQLEQKVEDLASRINQIDKLHREVFVQLDKDKNVRSYLLERFTNTSDQLQNLTYVTSNLTSECEDNKKLIHLSNEHSSNISTRMFAMENVLVNETINFHEKIDILTNNISGIKGSMNNFEGTLDNRIAELNTTLQKYNTLAIGFSVAEPDKEQQPAAGPLRFKHVEFNSDDMYNTSTGYVTFKVSGLYFFAITIVREPGITQSFCGLQINRAIMSFEYTVGYGSNNDGYYTGSTSLLYHISTSDTVSLADCHGTDHMHWSSSFTGFLVKADSL